MFRRMCTQIVLDLFVLLSKFYVYKSKWQNTASNLNAVLRIRKDRYTVERYRHIIPDKKTRFWYRMATLQGIDCLIWPWLMFTPHMLWAQFAILFILIPLSHMTYLSIWRCTVEIYCKYMLLRPVAKLMSIFISSPCLLPTSLMETCFLSPPL